jgi:hypothetical protein
MSSVKTGTVPKKTGVEMVLCGIVPASGIESINQEPEGSVHLEVYNRDEFDVGLDLAWEGISVKVTPPPEGFYDDPTFAIVELKDRRGNEARLNLSLDVARKIRKKLDAFFTKERERQTALLL